MLTQDEELRDLLRRTRTIAVLGIKTKAQAGQPAYNVPESMQSVGYRIVPVPVYYPEATEILGEPVVRDLTAVEPDMVNVFRKPSDLMAHLPALLQLHPKSVWLQRGIQHAELERALEDAGIAVVHDKCIMVEHARLVGAG